MNAPHPRVTRYLARATRGLWGKKRAEVCEELEAHLQERILAHRIAGMREEEATERALRDLGDPRAVSRGMVTLHSAPALVGSGLAAAAVAVMVVAVITTSTLAQQLPVTFTAPIASCLDVEAASEECLTHTPWISVASVQAALEPLGVGVEHRSDELLLDFPEAQTVSVPLRVLREPMFFGLSLPGQAPTRVSDAEVSPDYVDLWVLVSALSEQSGLSVRLEGWVNPRVHVGDVSFTVGSEELEVTPFEVYVQALRNAAYNRAHVRPEATSSTVLLAQGQHPARELRVDDTPGTVYGVIARTQPSARFVGLPGPLDFVFTVDAAPVDPDGTVTLHLHEDVRFVGSLQELIDAQPGDEQAVLLRFTGPFSVFTMEREVALEHAP